MNPLTLVKRIQNINLKEASLGISEDASWHAKYKDSAYVYVGRIPFDLTEGDLLAVFTYLQDPLEDKTPYEGTHNRKLELKTSRIFRCTAYAKITIPHLKKLDDRSIPMIYLGVEEGSKACRLYDPIARKKHVSRDVKFMETKPWDWNKDEEDTSTQDTFWTSFVVEGVDNENVAPSTLEINDKY
ncbi:hypothetical protein Tco_1051359 [Tanacetum coccineum]